MTNVLRPCVIAFCCLFLLAACDQESGTPTDTSTTDTGTDTPLDTGADVPTDTDPGDTATEPEVSETYSVSGTIGRTFGTCPPTDDGVGTLCVSIRTDCTDGTSEVAATTVPGANMSNPYATVNYTVTDVPNGSYQINAFLDDDNGGCDALGTGDFYLIAGCVGVTVDGADVSGADITFDGKY